MYSGGMPEMTGRIVAVPRKYPDLVIELFIVRGASGLENDRRGRFVSWVQFVKDNPMTVEDRTRVQSLLETGQEAQLSGLRTKVFEDIQN